MKHFYLIKNNFRNKYSIILLFLVVFVFSPVFVQTIIAQPLAPTTLDMSIDGGLSILLAAGIAFAARRLYVDKDKIRMGK